MKKKRGVDGMRFINALSYKSADYLMRQMNGNHESRRVYYYGFQIVIGALLKACYFCCCLYNRYNASGFDDSSGIVILRSIAGGYHMKTYGNV